MRLRYRAAFADTRGLPARRVVDDGSEDVELRTETRASGRMGPAALDQRLHSQFCPYLTLAQSPAAGGWPEAQVHARHPFQLASQFWGTAWLGPAVTAVSRTRVSL